MKYIYYPLVCGIILLSFSGCAHRRESLKQPGLSAGKIERYTSIAETGNSSDSVDIDFATGAIDLDQALTVALLHNPKLAVFAWEVRASEARAKQAGLISNPEFEFEMDDVNDKGFDEVLTSIYLSQPIGLAGKRIKRSYAANLSTNVAKLEFEILRLEVFAEVKKAFAKVIASQEKLGLSEEMVDLSMQTLAIVKQRVEAGRDSPIEEMNAQIALASAEMDKNRAKSDLVIAKTNLTTLCGFSNSQFEKAIGELNDIAEIPELNYLSEKALHNPSVKLYSISIDYSQKVLEFEKALRFPDLSVGAGVAHSSITREITYKVGLEIPVPLFDRNQGGVSEAKANLEKAIREREEAEIAITTELSETYQTMAIAFNEVIALRDNILPVAEVAFEGTGVGFRNGKYSYLEVLDAQRTLSELKSQYVETLITYNYAKADIERLITESLDDINE